MDAGQSSCSARRLSCRSTCWETRRFTIKGLPVPMHEVYKGPERHGATSVLGMLKGLLWPVLWHEARHSGSRRRFLEAGGKLLMLLHDRNGRRPFAPQDAF